MGSQNAIHANQGKAQAHNKRYLNKRKVMQKHYKSRKNEFSDVQNRVRHGLYIAIGLKPIKEAFEVL